MTTSNNPDAAMQKAIFDLTVKHEQLAIVVGRSLNSQEQLNAWVQRLVEQHEARIQSLEKAHALVDSRVPARVVDSVEMEKVNERLGEIEESVQVLNNRLAWFSGVCAVLVFAIPLGLQWLMK